eukprot:TRINITY_DN7245_c0_g1_i1.p1 TRINITY_DN7245_c0_g1~~TRINITY_DN7245_c0_g1_i1.p1  ORF type:complete len:108 (+),score=19.12 TRINITY_DN7245_c0_g1_i1:530-853(+)
MFCRIFRYMKEKCNFACTEDDLTFISDVINGKEVKADSSDCELINTNPKSIQIRYFQSKIVSNSLNGIDVDKLDYFVRDGHPNNYFDVATLIQWGRCHSMVSKMFLK